MSEDYLAGAFAIHLIREDEALRLFDLLCRRFGWTGRVITRDDADTAYRNQTESDAPMPNGVWEALGSTWAWKRGLSDMDDDTWSLVHDAVQDAIAIVAGEVTL